jgi:nucleoside-diphosphate-sugar epimerase
MGTVLVTGGGGFLGTHLASSLASAGEQVVLTYRRSYHVPQFLSDIMESKVKAVRCEVQDLPELLRVIRDYGVDSIVHAAMVADYSGTIYTGMQTNIIGTINVMEAAAIGSVKRVTYMSAGPLAMSFGETENISIASSGVSLITPSKKCAEIITLFYGEAYGISTVIVRGTGNFWGPYSEHEHRNQITLRAIMEGVVNGKPVNLPNIGSEEELSLNYGPDVAAAITVLHLAPALQRRVYLIPSAEITSWGEIADIVKEFVPGATIEFGRSDQPASIGHVFPEELAIASEFGFKPKYGVRGGLQEYIEWYKNR